MILNWRLIGNTKEDNQNCVWIKNKEGFSLKVTLICVTKKIEDT